MDKSNLIVFPGGGRATQAELLLKQFIKVYFIMEPDEQTAALIELKEAIFSYMVEAEGKGVKK